MRVTVSVDGARFAVRLRRAADRVGDPSPGLERAGFYMLLQLWERIVRRPVQVYSARYLRWLSRNGELSGKLWGILTGDLLGQSAPIDGAPSSADMGAELHQAGTSITVGHLNPASEPKARGFGEIYRSKFREWPYAPRPGDESDVGEVLQEWLAEALSREES